MTSGEREGSIIVSIKLFTRYFASKYCILTKWIRLASPEVYYYFEYTTCLTNFVTYNTWLISLQCTTVSEGAVTIPSLEVNLRYLLFQEMSTWVWLQQSYLCLWLGMLPTGHHLCRSGKEARPASVCFRFKLKIVLERDITRNDKINRNQNKNGKCTS